MKTRIVLFWTAVHASMALAQSSGPFSATANMSTPDHNSAAPNGKILIAGRLLRSPSGCDESFGGKA